MKNEQTTKRLKNNYLHIGKNLKKIFKEKKVVVSELAKKIGYTREHMYTLYTKEDINTNILKKIAEELNINITELIVSDNTVMNTTTTTIVKDKNNTTTINVPYNITKERVIALEKEVTLLRELLKSKDDYIKLLTKKK